jgi:hypothetical protein
MGEGYPEGKTVETVGESRALRGHPVENRVLMSVELPRNAVARARDSTGEALSGSKPGRLRRAARTGLLMARRGARFGHNRVLAVSGETR